MGQEDEKDLLPLGAQQGYEFQRALEAVKASWVCLLKVLQRADDSVTRDAAKSLV